MSLRTLIAALRLRWHYRNVTSLADLADLIADHNNTVCPADVDSCDMYDAVTSNIPAGVFGEIKSDIVDQLRTGHRVWFSDDDGEGFREVEKIDYWVAEPHTYERTLALDWMTVTYTDGFVEERVRYGTHPVWRSGPCPMVNR